jgi:hypothetical protein
VRLPSPRRGLLALALVAVGATLAPAQATPHRPAGATDLVDRSCRLVTTADGTAAAGNPQAAPPVGNTACTGIRPGAEYLTTVGYCTLAWVFAGSDGATYVASAGHCTLDTVEATKKWAVGKGPLAGDPVTGKEFGRFVYATQKSGETDFALIRLNRGVKANPQMCHFGGPTGMAKDVATDAVLLQHYGNGIGMENSRARTASAVQGLRRPDWITAFGVMTPGDSGGPVSLDGLAVGTVDELRANGNGNVAITRLPAAVAAAAKSLRIRLTLRTAPAL